MHIVVVGAGVVGLTMINLLASLDNVTLTLIAPNIMPKELDSSTYDLRCSALVHSSVRVLNSIGIWQAIYN